MTTPTWRALISHELPEVAVERLRSELQVDTVHGYLDLSRAELIDRARGAHALLSYSDAIDDEMLAALPDLRVIATHWGEWNTGLHEAATRRGILVTSPPDQYNWIVGGVADLIIGLFLAGGRRMVEADSFSRGGRMDHHEASNHHLLGQGLFDATVGLIGAGRIGQAVAKRLAGFGSTVLYSDPRPNPELDRAGAEHTALDELLRRSDFVSLSVPENELHVVGAAEFAKMKQTAVFVNTGRGRAVDEVALARALSEGAIAAAGLDVYEKEPEISQELLDAPNAILMPHAGGALRRARERAALFMAESVLDAMRGRSPRGLLNPEVLARSESRA
ncbi:NAD(P)-dependent oxidoreductase [Microbacterium sp. SSM24]|uniref:NAD(P)-dependent oxidoreductase n=1 Tax=Microbacterium sp. SSM24 TaxID=2991714 RepID=UPI0022267FF8|nr:NAD(P)-dependent oxidoreductase [Microbacterium sp. SSM24]MCW3492581.1 D-glycerate dehydrogenase [Microbacterium sp. SSM24]